MASSTIFWVFGITVPGIEPRSSGPLANTLLVRPKARQRCYLFFIWLVEFWFYISDSVGHFSPHLNSLASSCQRRLQSKKWKVVKRQDTFEISNLFVLVFAWLLYSVFLDYLRTISQIRRWNALVVFGVNMSKFGVFSNGWKVHLVLLI